MFRRMMSGVAVAVVLLASGSAVAQDFSAQRLSDHIKVLSDDDMAGRFPGSPQEEMVLDYLQSQYEAMGLQPGGPNGQWRQDVELVRFTPARPPTASWTDRDGLSHLLVAASDINLRGMTGDGQVRIDGAPLVFAGYGIVAPERHWDDYGDIDLTGKVVLILGGQPTAFGEDPNFYGSTTHKEAEALKRGAVGVITLNEAGATEPRWLGAGRRSGRPRMTIQNGHAPRFTGSINMTVAEAMATSMGGDMTALVAMAKQGGSFRAHDSGLRLGVDISETPQVIHSHNLLAKIPGTTHPDEYLVYSAHWDHVGTAAQPDATGDRIFNGAWDNASGTSGIMEMARAFKAGPPPERTVVFLHVTAEEQGLLGSEWYAANPVYPLEKTAADINIDMLPFTPATRNVAIFGPGKSSLEDDLGRLADAQGHRVVTGDGYPEEGFYYRSDHFNFAVGGVPALMPWTGTDFNEGGVAVGKPYYEAQMATYYHNLNDEWRPDYDFTAAIQNLDLLYRLGEEVANTREWPQWKPTAEFRAVRAASDAARR